MTDGTRLSVVIANFNHAAFLPECLSAIAEQSLPADEIIVVDDGSTDESVAIIESFRKVIPITLIRHPKNVGAIESYREGLAAVSGAYVHLAAADDRVESGFFEQTVQMLDRYPAAGFSSSLTQIIDRESRPLGIMPTAVVSPVPAYLSPQQTARAARRYGYWALTNASIYRTCALEAVGGFRSDLSYRTDAFFTEVIGFRYGACFIPSVLTSLRQTGENLAASLFSETSIRRQVDATVQAISNREFFDVVPPGYADECFAFDTFRADLDDLAAQHQRQVGAMPPSIRPLRTLATLLSIDARLALLLVRNLRVWWRSRTRTRRTRASLRSIGVTSDQLAW